MLFRSPSPVKLRAGSEMPVGSVVYPKLRGIDYPPLLESEEPQAESPSRRLTFGGTTADNATQFSFKSDKAINFGPPSTDSIRVIGETEAPGRVEGKKRKLDTPEEASDKENSQPADTDGRSSKKVKMSEAEPPKTPSKAPSSVSKLPRRTPKKGGASISKSRLAFLSTPKHSNA